MTLSDKDLKDTMKAIEKLCNESKPVYPDQNPKVYMLKYGLFVEIKDLKDLKI